MHPALHAPRPVVVVLQLKMVTFKLHVVPCQHAGMVRVGRMGEGGRPGEEVTICCHAHLGSIQGHADASRPVQLLRKGWGPPRLLQHVIQRPSGAELGDYARRLQAQAHEHDHIWVAQSCHNGHLQLRPQMSKP